MDVRLYAKALELINIPTALKSKVLKQPKGCILIQQGKRKHARFLDQLMRKIGFVDSNRDASG